jgi:hypothetical protein
VKVAEQAVQAFQHWLETAKGHACVRHLAGQQISRAGENGSLPVLFASRFGSDDRDVRQELASEFMVFLVQFVPEQVSCRPDLINCILSGQPGKVLDFALQQFLWRLQDQARHKEVNPRAHLHRRLREAVTADPAFTVQRDQQRTLFYFPASCSEELCTDSAVFASLQYLDWPVPPLAEQGEQTLFTAKYLVAAAHFFWEECRCQLGQAYRVPFREAVRYLAVHYTWLNRLQLESLDDDAYAAGTEPAEEQLDSLNGLASVAVLAEQFVRGLDEPARLIFAWKMEENPRVSFKEIAARLGMKDHNRPYRIYQETVAAMQVFVKNWPGPPLAELPEAVGLAFIDGVRKKCGEQADSAVRY